MSPVPPFFAPWLLAVSLAATPSAQAQTATSATVTLDTSAAGRRQTVDGFGTCLGGTEGQQTWWQSLYFDALRCTLLRVDLTPQFVSPHSDYTYNSPWFHNHPPLPGPDNNNARTYTDGSVRSGRPRRGSRFPREI